MAQRPTLDRLVQRHLSRQAAVVDRPDQPMTALDFLGLTEFFLAFEAITEAGGDAPSKEVQALLKKAALIAVQELPAIEQGIATYITPIQAKVKTIAPALRLILGGGVNRALAVGKALRSILPMLRRHALELKEAFKKYEDRARKIAVAAEQDVALSRLNAIASLPEGRGQKRLRNWILKAAEVLGVAPTAVEQAMSGAALGQELGQELREIEAAISVEKNPKSARAAKLQEKRLAILGQIQNTAEANPHPEVVLATAAVAKAKPRTQVTDVGYQLSMTPAQEDAMMVMGKAVIAAGAGSGKTRVLAGKVVDTIKRLNVPSSQIIATSFSKKSAAELKDRIINYGGESIFSGGDKGIGTTHSIGFGMLREFESGRYSSIKVDAGDTIVRMAMEQVMMRPTSRVAPAPPPVGMFDGLYATRSPERAPGAAPGMPPTAAPEHLMLTQVLKAMANLASWGQDQGFGWATQDLNVIEPILQEGRGPADLSPREKASVNKLLGMERYQKKLTRANLDTNYRVAADRGLGAARGKSIYWKEPANQAFNLGLDLLVDDDGFAIGPKRASTAISKFRANMITASQAWADNSQGNLAFRAIYMAFEWLKKNDPINTNTIDFDDMLEQACKMLIANPKALAAVQGTYKHVLVDEAQDLNKCQHLLFGLVAGYIDPKTLKTWPDRHMTADALVFIGDDKQAIYGFRGAIPDEFINKSDLVEGGEGFATKLLPINYRSGERIVDAANKLIAHNSKQIPMVCEAIKKGQGSIFNVVISDHEAGAKLVADQITMLVKGEAGTMSYKDFGVAVRTNAEAYAFGVEMIKQGIPFRSKVNFFNDLTTKTLINWLKLVVTDMSDKGTINDIVLSAHTAPKFWLDTTFNQGLQERARGQNYLTYLQDGWRNIYQGQAAWKNEKNVKPYAETLWQVRAMTGSPTDILQQILRLEGVGVRGQAAPTIIDGLIERIKGSPEAMDLMAEQNDGSITEEDVKNMALAPVQPLIGLLGGYEDLGPALTYVTKLQKVADQKHKEDDPDDEHYKEPAVVIDTCHGWKGLEVEQIFINMPAGVFPHARSFGSEEDMADERRLAYVAITRGKQRVTILNPELSHLGKKAGVSQFVDEACIHEEGHEEDPAYAGLLGKQASIDREAFLEAFLRGDFDQPMTELEQSWGPTEDF